MSDHSTYKPVGGPWGEWESNTKVNTTDDTLDELARDLGYRLDILLARQELSEGFMSDKVVHNRVNTLATTYGVTKDEIRRQIGDTE